jgi:hypothetical protein
MAPIVLILRPISSMAGAVSSNEITVPSQYGL